MLASREITAFVDRGREYPVIVQARAEDRRTPGDLANRLQEMEVYGLPENYFDQYRERIAAVTEEDLQRVANKYIDPSRMAIVIVGKADTIREPLSQLGYPVSVYDIEGRALPR